MNIIAENPIVLSYKKRLIRYPEEDEAERWDGVALDFYLRTGTVPDEVLHYKALALAGLRSLKYRDDQPRVPAGNPDGGQWTAEGGSGESVDGEGIDGDSGNNEEDPAQVLPAAYRPKARYSARRGRMLQNYSKHPNKKSYDEAKDPLFKDGDLIGQRGTTDDIRILNKVEFENLRARLLHESHPVEVSESYKSRAYERPDGTFFGLRHDKDHGETIDILESPNLTVRPGTKVHQK